MKREREIRELVRKAGLEFVSLTISGGNHIKACVRRADGQAFQTIHPLTPSDHRGERNKLSELRRIAKGIANPIQPRSKH